MPLSIAESCEILGVDANASQEDIRKAYKKKAVATHPDKNPGDSKAAENFQKVNAAYNTLLDKKHAAASTDDAFSRSHVNKNENVTPEEWAEFDRVLRETFIFFNNLGNTYKTRNGYVHVHVSSTKDNDSSDTSSSVESSSASDNSSSVESSSASDNSSSVESNSSSDSGSDDDNVINFELLLTRDILTPYQVRQFHRGDMNKKLVNNIDYLLRLAPLKFNQNANKFLKNLEKLGFDIADILKVSHDSLPLLLDFIISKQPRIAAISTSTSIGKVLDNIIKNVEMAKYIFKYEKSDSATRLNALFDFFKVIKHKIILLEFDKYSSEFKQLLSLGFGLRQITTRVARSASPETLIKLLCENYRKIDHILDNVDKDLRSECRQRIIDLDSKHMKEMIRLDENVASLFYFGFKPHQVLNFKADKMAILREQQPNFAWMKGYYLRDQAKEVVNILMVCSTKDFETLIKNSSAKKLIEAYQGLLDPTPQMSWAYQNNGKGNDKGKEKMPERKVPVPK